MFKSCIPLKTILILGLFSVLVLQTVSCTRYAFPDKSTVASDSDLVFTSLAASWDEAIPLGNAVVGSLVWEKEGSLRMSLDRTDLWDLRPADSLAGDRFKFSWVTDHVRSGDYLPVQQKLDVPYDRDPAPSKIPGAALEFGALGEVGSVRLYLWSALCEVVWKSGTRMYSFIDADRPVGWFVFENVPEDFRPVIVPPPYSRGSDDATNPVTGQDLSRLGYPQGEAWTFMNRHYCLHKSFVGGECKIRPGKKLFCMVAQGAPDNPQYRENCDALLRPFDGWGFDRQPILVASGREAEAKIQEAYELGKRV